MPIIRIFLKLPKLPIATNVTVFVQSGLLADATGAGFMEKAELSTHKNKQTQHERSKMIRVIQLGVACAVGLIATAGQADAAMLIGVTGDGANTASTLYSLNTTNASATFLMTLGNGNDGETIGFNPADGLLYHASGDSSGTPVWESIDTDSATYVTSGQFTGRTDSTLAITYNSATGKFLVADYTNGFFESTLAGVASSLGTTPEQLKGLAFVGTALYGASVGSNTLYSLNPLDGSVISSVIVTLDGNPVTHGMRGLATDPDTGVLWGIFKIGGNFFLGTLNPNTGSGTSVGQLPDNFAGLAFTSAAAVPEPSSLALFGMVACFAGVGVVRRRRREKQQKATA